MKPILIQQLHTLHFESRSHWHQRISYLLAAFTNRGTYKHKIYASGTIFDTINFEYTTFLSVCFVSMFNHIAFFRTTTT